MSFSKPLTSEKLSTPEYAWPRGVQLGVVIGLPIAVVAAAGFCWWTGVFSSDSKVKKPGTADTLSTAKSLPTPEPTKKPEDPRPAYLKLKEQGNDAFRRNDLTTALELYGEAIAQCPPVNELSVLFQNRAAVFERLGDWVQVINESTAALNLNPKYVKALTRRSKAYKATGFMDEALEDVTAVCVLETFNNALSIQIADEILKDIGRAEAEEILKHKRPSPPSVHAVASFIRAFHCDPVTKWWTNPTVSIPIANGHNNSDSNANIGGFRGALLALTSRKYDNIIDLCTQEIESGDEEHLNDAYLLRATFMHLWGFRSEVLEDLNKITESKTATNEFKASALVKIGAHVAIQDDLEYEQYFERAEQLCENCVDIYHQLGQILLTRGDFERAIVQINKASEIAPDFPLASASKWYVQYRIATLNIDDLAIENALKNFTKCMRQFNKSPDVFNLYGQILMEIGRFQEAITQFDRVIELDPTNASIYVHKAVARFQVDGDKDLVLRLLRDSLKIDDRNEFVYETIGTLELQAGNLESSIEAIKKAIELAKTPQELVMLSSLKKAAEVQVRVKEKYNIIVPAVPAQGNSAF